MAFRPAGMSDSSSDEFIDNDTVNFAHSNKKKIDNNNCNEYYKEVQGQNEEQDRQFNVLTACMTGHITIIDDYINLGRDVNTFFYTGWTMLLYASSAMMPEVIKYLLELGADPNIHKDGYTPLMAVCDSTKGTTEQCLQCITLLLEAKANPEAANKDRKVPLMYACKSREPEVIIELLKYVKNIEATDSDGRTAIFYAVASNKPEIVKILMKQKASTTVVDRHNLSPSDIALAKNFDEILQILRFEHEDIDDYCPVFKVLKWQDTLSNTNHCNLDCIDEDIANILYALGLDKYRRKFTGMNLRTFLQLTEDDLIQLGMDIEFHRKQFIAGLFRFHSAKWKPKSIKIVDKSKPFTIFDGVMSLTNIARQIRIIGSSFQFITNNLLKSNGNKIILDSNEKDAIKKDLKETETILVSLKNDFQRMLNFAQTIEKENRDISTTAYISPNESKKKKTQWMIIISVALMTGMFLSKTAYVQKLLN
ncbi:hypothetical protein PV325_007607 [Microctonus aethiopoides]|uniref:SAM domain-containing protein n=1 Tax=Microctonus aethiopoides TaxID=144406 RepID=A0AA39KWI7_9HYME|nr:hypothetical protein PV325_007607 [Microctonus aethiopoides]KAK0176364.1 hypothetical protein PV328_000508 [Microctonus aethiopoides]